MTIQNAFAVCIAIHVNVKHLEIGDEYKACFPVQGQEHRFCSQAQRVKAKENSDKRLHIHAILMQC